MTKEELEKEAEESAKKFFGKPTDLVDLDNLRIFKNGYFASAEPREKRIACLTLACENYREEMEKNLADTVKLEKENAELKERLLKVENAYKRKSEAEWRLNDLYQKLLTDYANAEKCSREYFTRYRVVMERSIKAEQIIRDFLSVAIDYIDKEDKNYSFIVEAEQFIKDNEVEK